MTKPRKTSRSEQRQALGRRGEKLARKHLKRLGYRHVRSNYRVEGGEIDLVMQDGEMVVFVEVKTRGNEAFASGEAAVNYGKRQRLTYAARHFIQAYELHDYPCRFDVVAVVTAEQGPPVIRHQINAFQPSH